MDKQLDNFFIFGAPRSGTTFLSKLFQMATNAQVFSEQSPKLGYESRQKHLGNFINFEHSKQFIKVQKQDCIDMVNARGLIYGDKNMNFLPFIEEMSVVWPNAKFVFIYRDGRDVVSSLINWNKSGRRIFQMKEDIGEGGTEIPIHDLWDYSRIRPNKGESHHDEWQELSLFEKSAIYWSYYNEASLQVLEQLDKSRYFAVDVSHSSVHTYKELFEFLRLNGFNEAEVQHLMTAKVNSLGNTTVQKSFPNWEKWDDSEKELFEAYAGQTYQKLFGEIKW